MLSRARAVSQISDGSVLSPSTSSRDVVRHLADIPADGFDEWNCLPIKFSGGFISQITGSAAFVTRGQALTMSQP